jgi:hypothetical protein
MNRTDIVFAHTKLIFIFTVLLTQGVLAQGYGDPLTMQGVDHTTLQSVASRSEGGTTIGIQNDVGLMFTNPASLQSLQGMQISFGGLSEYTSANQVQQYSPLKYYSNFSLLMEGLTGYIPNPSDTLVSLNAGDTVQRPFDNIGPNWSHTKTKTLPLQALIGVPISVGSMKIVAGLGAVEYANLNDYYENHNVLSPSIGNERPVPVSLPASDSMPFETEWSSYLRTRDGSIQGYGAAISGALSEKISLGISDMILTGSSDDYEQSIARGRLVFFREYFRLDSIYAHTTQTGTSDYSGNELTLGGVYRGRYVSVGFSVNPPATITRTYSAVIQTDTTGSSTTTSISGKDKIQLPWQGSVGISLQVTKNLTLGLEYEIRSYSSAVYTSSNGTQSNPWLSSTLLHAGGEFTPLPWLIVRAGVREQAEVFQEAGNPLPGDPVSYSVYSVGCGVLFGGVRFDVAYEYSLMKYDDLWQTNVNLNSETQSDIIADVAYEIPWAQ